jgi:hypothetical protein
MNLRQVGRALRGSDRVARDLHADDFGDVPGTGAVLMLCRTSSFVFAESGYETTVRVGITDPGSTATVSVGGICHCQGLERLTPATA